MEKEERVRDRERGREKGDRDTDTERNRKMTERERQSGKREGEQKNRTQNGGDISNSAQVRQMEFLCSGFSPRWTGNLSHLQGCTSPPTFEKCSRT